MQEIQYTNTQLVYIVSCTKSIAIFYRLHLHTMEVVSRKEMFCLTTHSTHFIYGCMASDIWQRTTQIAREEGKKEGNILFNDAVNTFYLRLYGVRHMVKDHSDSERGTHYRHMGYSFRLAATVLLYASSHRQDNTYHGICYTSRGALTGKRQSSKGPP